MKHADKSLVHKVHGIAGNVGGGLVSHPKGRASTVPLKARVRFVRGECAQTRFGHEAEMIPFDDSEYQR